MVDLLGKDDSEKGNQSQLRRVRWCLKTVQGEGTPGGGEDRLESWVLPLRSSASRETGPAWQAVHYTNAPYR